MYRIQDAAPGYTCHAARQNGQRGTCRNGIEYSRYDRRDTDDYCLWCEMEIARELLGLTAETCSEGGEPWPEDGDASSVYAYAYGTDGVAAVLDDEQEFYFDASVLDEEPDFDASDDFYQGDVDVADVADQLSVLDTANVQDVQDVSEDAANIDVERGFFMCSVGYRDEECSCGSDDFYYSSRSCIGSDNASDTDTDTDSDTDGDGASLWEDAMDIVVSTESTDSESEDEDEEDGGAKVC